MCVYKCHHIIINTESTQFRDPLNKILILCKHPKKFLSIFYLLDKYENNDESSKNMYIKL